MKFSAMYVFPVRIKNGINTEFTSLTYSRSGTHVLISFIGSSTLGEHFNPAKDCSDIVEKNIGKIFSSTK